MKFYFLILTFFLTTSTVVAEPISFETFMKRSGCCSHHGGVSNSCYGNRARCNDGSISPSCECEISGGGKKPTKPASFKYPSLPGTYKGKLKVVAVSNINVPTDFVKVGNKISHQFTISKKGTSGISLSQRKPVRHSTFAISKLKGTGFKGIGTYDTDQIYGSECSAIETVVFAAVTSSSATVKTTISILCDNAFTVEIVSKGTLIKG